MTVGALAGGFAIVKWTFAVPFAAGAQPVVVATAENTGTASQPLVVNLVSPATATDATFIVFQAASTTLGATLAALLGAVIAPFKAAASGAVINAVARLPTA